MAYDSRRAVVVLADAGGLIVRTQCGGARLTEARGFIQSHPENGEPLRETDMPDGPILERLNVAVPSGVVLDGVPFSKIAAATEPLVR